jgi:hypothetical protein
MVLNAHTNTHHRTPDFIFSGQQQQQLQQLGALALM